MAGAQYLLVRLKNIDYVTKEPSTNMLKTCIRKLRLEVAARWAALFSEENSNYFGTERLTCSVT